MKMLKAVSFHCPKCECEVEMKSVALGENMSIYILGECCGEWITVDLEKIVISLSAGKYAN